MNAVWKKVDIYGAHNVAEEITAHFKDTECRTPREFVLTYVVHQHCLVQVPIVVFSRMTRGVGSLYTITEVCIAKCTLK